MMADGTMFQGYYLDNNCLSKLYDLGDTLRVYFNGRDSDEDFTVNFDEISNESS